MSLLMRIFKLKPLTIASMIALPVVRTSFEFHLREGMTSCSPPPPPPPPPDVYWFHCRYHDIIGLYDVYNIINPKIPNWWRSENLQDQISNNRIQIFPNK